MCFVVVKGTLDWKDELPVLCHDELLAKDVVLILDLIARIAVMLEVGD